MNVSEYIFDFFSKKGVDTAFMVTGGQAMFLNDAIGRNPAYKIICHHHEQACAMAADAYGRIRNKPAITLVTAGPGACNALTGVVGGYTDSSPMIVISGHTNLPFVRYQEKTNIRQYGVQGINIGPIVKNVVKYFKTIDDPQTLQQVLETAYETATQGRPGPVWIEVPLDVQKAQVPVQKPVVIQHESLYSLSDVQKAAKAAYEKICNAKRPVLLVGQGVALSGAREIFEKVAHQMRIPVITARLGIDLIPSDDELYVGRPGNYGERAANIAIQNADVVLSIGCRLASSLVGHNPRQFAENAFVMAVDIDVEELDKPNCHIDYKVLGDAGAFLHSLQACIAEKACPDFSAWVAQCNDWKKRYPVVQESYKDEKPVNSYLFADALSRHTPNDAMIVVDTGSCFHVVCQSWKIKKGQHFLTTGGISSMGYWAACIGACVANDCRQTICVTGDGSLQMNLQEFATIAHNKLPIKVFVFNNNGYLLIRHTQRNFMQDRFVGESPDSGVWCPDTLKIAQAYGIAGVRIDSVEQMDQKIEEVLSAQGPVVCEVMTPQWQLLIPRISSEKLPDGTLVAHDYDDMFPFLDREEVHRNRLFEREEK